jgi:lysophospholipase L1-like esterase
MSWTRSLIIKGFGYFLIAIGLYLSLLPGIYLLSSLLFIKGVVLRQGFLRDFQRDFYTNRGYRNIWQMQKECVEFDERLIYVPRIGSCRFANPEFDTTLNFEASGRLRNGMSQKRSEIGIAVLGDSYAMGWGVNDGETFANIIQDELKRPVYNLGVSSYGTVRELLRLQQLALIDKVDTILIQYSGNDFMENEALDQEEKFLQAKTLFQETFKRERSSADPNVPQSIKSAVSFAIEKPMRNLRDMFFKARSRNQFAPHYQQLIPVLKRFAPLVNKKRIVVFCVDEDGFDDFPNGKDKIIGNLEFVDLKLETEDFYIIDSHLNSLGHAKVGRMLTGYLSEPALAEFDASHKNGEGLKVK